MRLCLSLLLVFCLSAPVFADDVDDLLAKLGSENWTEREAASKSLAEKGPDIIPRLIEAYKSTEEAEVKKRIDKLLKGFGHPTATAVSEIDELIDSYRKLLEEPLTKTEFDEKRGKLAERVKKLEHAATYLAGLLAGRGRRDRESALAFLLDAALDAVSEGALAGGARSTGVTVIGGKVVVRMGNGRTITLGDETNETDSGYRTPVSVLVRGAGSDDERVSKAALDALVRRKDLSAVPGLLKILSPSEEGVRPPLLRQVRRMDPEQKKKALKARRLRLADALRRMTGRTFGPDEKTADEDFSSEIDRWTDWWKTARNAPEYRLAEMKEKMLVLDLKEKDFKRRLRAIEKKRRELKKTMEGLEEPRPEPQEEQK